MWWLCSQTGKILNEEDDPIVLLEEANVRLHAHPQAAYAVDTITGDRIERDPRMPLPPKSAA
jgi:predicted ATP-dependent endonuclease of OLD family